MKLVDSKGEGEKKERRKEGKRYVLASMVTTFPTSQEDMFELNAFAR